MQQREEDDHVEHPLFATPEEKDDYLMECRNFMMFAKARERLFEYFADTVTYRIPDEKMVEYKTELGRINTIENNERLSYWNKSFVGMRQNTVVVDNLDK